MRSSDKHKVRTSSAPETPKDFEKEAGIPMVLDTFDNAEVMQSKLMVGHTGYDVVVATSDVLPNLIKAGVLQELDRSQLSKWSNLDAKGNAERAKNGRQLAYRIPREGSSVWIESLVLLKDAPHPQQGMSFIDYMMRPEVIAKSSNYLGYPNANSSATPFVDQAIRDNPGAYPSAATMATLFPAQPLPLKIERIRTRVWSKVKSGT